MKDELREPELTTTMEETKRVQVETINANVKTWVGVTVFVCALAIGWQNLKGDMVANQKDLNALRQSVTKIEENLKAFDRLSAMSAEIADIKKNGSDALTTTKAELETLRTEFRIHVGVAKLQKDGIQMP